MENNRIVKILLYTALICLIVAMVGIYAGCEDKSYQQEKGYVEVSALRLSETEIKMAPMGEPSTYQLNVQILPATATNQKLTYYIPAQYLTYVTVSENGLLTAKENTGDIKVPLTITSTSNKNATVSAVIIVEEVSVTEIRFTESQVDLLYNGKSTQVHVEFFPSHAINGRELTFEYVTKPREDKNDPVFSIETDKSGITTITPLRAGQAHLKAVSSPSNSKQNEAFLLVTVSYVEAQLQLQVSENPPPQWSQVVGENSPITFTLLILGESIDPNPTISWYEGTTRRADVQNKRQFTHTPSSVTAITYNIKVRVRMRIDENTDKEVELTSRDIVIYNDFTGFDLQFNNLSSIYTPYQYGDTATFAMTDTSSSSTVQYRWYLQKIGGDNTKLFVGNTPVSDKNLIRRLNITGDYRLTAEAVDERGNALSSTPFSFSVERIMIGDTLVVKPSLKSGGLPPDSYNWYIVPCDADGNYDVKNKVEIKSTAGSETFYYRLTKTGNFRLLVTSTTGGVPSTVYDEASGTRVAYQCESVVLRVYDADTLYKTDSNTDYTIEEFSSLPTSVLLGDTFAFSSLTYQGENLSSYQLSVAVCDYQGNQTSISEIVSVAGERTFVPKTGYFRFVLQTGDDTVRSELITVRAKDIVTSSDPTAHLYLPVNAQRVEQITVDGIRISGESMIRFSWQPVTDVTRYIVEITYADGKVSLFDSADTSVGTFGANFVYFSSSILSLDGKYMVRVKQKDSLYSPTYYYGIANVNGVGDNQHTLAFEEEVTAYFDEVSLGINLYILSEEELATLAEYILLNKPTQNAKVQKDTEMIDGSLYDTYAVDFYSVLDESGNYEVPEGVPENCKAVYSLIQKAVASLPIDTAFVLDISKNENGSYHAIFKIENGKSMPFSLAVTATTGTTKSSFYAQTPYGSVGEITFVAENKNALFVSDSDQLVAVLEQGFRPVPKNNDNLAQLYKVGLKTLVAVLVSAEMTDAEKALAFYDWLALNVAYDNNQDGDYTSSSHTLEGVFNHRKAYSDGFAKAFSALCNIVGIPCKTVCYTAGNRKFAYDLVRIEEQYYIVDASFARTVTAEGVTYVDHSYFLTTEKNYRTLLETDSIKLTILSDYATADKPYNLYGSVGTNDADYFISNVDELSNLLLSVTQTGKILVEFCCDKTGELTSLTKLNTALSTLRLDKQISGVYKKSANVDGNICVCIILTDE